MGRSPAQIRAYHESQAQQAQQIEIKNAAYLAANPEIAKMLQGPGTRYGTPFFTATGRKALQASGGLLEPAVKAQLGKIEADRIQAEQRARAGAVGAASEAIKQKEQRAVAASQGIAIGSIGKDVINTSVNSVTGVIKQSSQPSSSMLSPPKEEPKVQGGILYKVKLEDSAGVSSGVSGAVSEPVPKGAFVLGPASGEPILATFDKPVLQKTKRTGQEPLQILKFGQEGFGPKEQSFLDKLLQDTEKFTQENKNNILGTVGSVGRGFLSDIAFFGTNLPKIVERETIKFVTGKEPKSTDADLIEIPETTVTKFIGGEAEAIGKAFSSGKPQELVTGTGKAFQETVEFGKQQGGYLTAGDIIDIGIPFAPQLTKISPIGRALIKIPVATSKGIETTSGIVLKGLGKEVPLITKQPGKAIKIGGPTDDIIKNISPTGRGFEIGTASKLEQKILTDPNVLAKAGISAQAIERSLIVKEIAELVGKTKGTKIFKEGLPEQPVKSLLPGAETKTAIKVLAEEQKGILGLFRKMGTIKGSLSALPQLPPDLRRVAKDIDIDFPPIPGAQRVAKKFVERENIIVKLGRIFEATGKEKTKVQTRTGRETEKVLELLTKADIDESSSTLNKVVGSVFGQKAGKKVVKTKLLEDAPKLKFTTLRQQTLRKAASVASILGPRTEGGPLKGLDINAPSFRQQKDIFDLYAGAQTFGRYASEFGLSTKQGKRLLELAEKLKKNNPGVDFTLPGIDAGKIEFETGITLAEQIGKASPGIEKSVSSLGKSTPLNIKPETFDQELNASELLQRKKIQQQSKASLKTKTEKNIDSFISNAISKSPSSSIFKSTKSSIPSFNIDSFGSRLSRSSKASPGSIGKSSINIKLKSPASPITKSPGRSSPINPFSPGSPITKSPGTPGRPTRKTPPGRSPGSPFSPGKITNTPIFPPVKLRAGAFFKFEKEERRRRKLPTKLEKLIFIAGPADIQRAGVFAARGVPELRSKDPKIFKDIDKLLGKARRRKGATRPLTF